jgi:TolB-like protein/DNA-binding winged helix-turn-helix (wHTH) protein/predicted Zn-dependent protease
MPGSHILSFGPYRLDMEKVRLWCDTQPVRLTPKAFQVLCYIVERPGQLVTKEELFRVVWADTVVGDAALTMCIQEIRKALQDNAKSPQYLETVHRQGFRFIAEVVSSQEEEENQKAKVEEAEQEIEKLESQAEGRRLEAEGPRLVSPPRSWPVRSLLGMGLVLLVGILLTVQYLSRSTLGTRNLELGTQPAPQGLALPDKPSIIVLPFVNLSSDPGQEYFSDGMTEEITAALSRLSSLFVIARTSAFTYKGNGAKVQDISQQMRVRYVLEGSARKTDAQVRIIAQLIDATTGEYLWSERYDRPLTDIFAIQDEIVQKIATTLKLQLPLIEQGYFVGKLTNNPEAYDFYLRGLAYWHHTTREDNLQARQMCEKAIALDPHYAEAYVLLGFTYYMEWIWGWSQDPHTLEQGVVMGQRAVALDDAGHGLLGLLYAQQKQYDLALAESERAIALDPNNAAIYAQRAEVLNVTGKPEEALRAAEHAIRLNPRGSGGQLITLASAYHLLGRCTEAISTLKSLLVRYPDWPSAYPMLSFSYVFQWAFQQNEDSHTLTQALEAAQRAVALNGSYGFAHAALGLSYLFQRQHEQAIAEMEQVVGLAPSDASSYAALALALSYAGKSGEALGMVEEALLRKPSVVDQHLSPIGAAYYFAGKPAEAIAPLQQYLSRYPYMLLTHLTLTAAYSELGQIAEARAAVTEVLRLNPNFSLKVYKQRMPLKDPATLERHIAALRKAGLK